MWLVREKRHKQENKMNVCVPGIRNRMVLLGYNECAIHTLGRRHTDNGR